MKLIYFALIFFTVIFIVVGVYGFVKINAYSSFFDGVESDKAFAYNYYQLYQIDTSLYTFDLDSENSSLKITKDNIYFDLSLKIFDQNNIKLFFEKWGKLNKDGVTRVVPPPECKFLEIKLQYKPNQSYTSLAQYNEILSPDNGLPLLCLDKLYENSIEKIY